MANDNWKPVDKSYIDGPYAANYWSLTEATREWEESEGHEVEAEIMQNWLTNRPTWTYDANGMIISYE